MSANKDFNSHAKQLIELFSRSQVVHANSLILTIFGDYICAHGGTVWLGSLIKLVEPLGINQRLVRTSVFRLTENDILKSRQIGRRSYYSLTEKGYRQFNTASERIYRYHNIIWDGEWRLVFTTLKNISNDDKERFQKELVWLGFNRLSNGVYAHPTASIEQVKNIVSEMQIEDSVVIMQATSMDNNPLKSSANLVKYCFNFDVMKEEYQAFIEFFQDILVTAENSQDDKDEELCFLLRTLLIHKFRRILFKEPELPPELVPADCLSHRAREITEKLYKSICVQAERYLLKIGEAEQGKLPRVNKEYYTRFGGLPK